MEEIIFDNDDILRGFEFDKDLSIRYYGNEGIKYKYVSYDLKSKTINIKTGTGGIYDVPLNRCKTAGECLDWIHQLHVKTWFDEVREKEFIDILLRLIPCELWSGGGK